MKFTYENTELFSEISKKRTSKAKVKIAFVSPLNDLVSESWK